jgi:hypothetical protein
LIARDAILQGGGKLILSNSSGSTNIFGNGTGNSTLTNVDNTISGFGTINETLVNQSKGVIDANSSGSSLFLYGMVSNAGTLEATSGGGLAVLNTITDSSSGVVGAFGVGSTLNVAASVIGGTLETSGGGQIQVTGHFMVPVVRP